MGVALKVHTTLEALERVAFWVWVVFGLLFGCGVRGFGSHSHMVSMLSCGCSV